MPEHGRHQDDGSLRLWNVSLVLTGLGLIFGLQVLLARLMGPAAYGDYTVIVTTINLFLVLSVFGFDSSVLKFLPAYLSNNDHEKANGFVKFSYRLITILSISLDPEVDLLFKESSVIGVQPTSRS